jgi:Zn-dependent peptidase ImmA (M78 family)
MSTKFLNPAYIPSEQIKQTADQIRNACAMGIFPVPIELIIERDCKLGIWPEPGLRSIIRSDAYLSTNFQSIYVDRDIYMNDRYLRRNRFSLAHELGHFALHRALYSKFHFASTKDYLEFIESFEPCAWDRVEKQANIFASNILMPEEVVIEKAKAFREEIERKGLNDRDEYRKRYRVLQRLTDFFEVSEDSMQVRTDYLKVFSFSE